MSFSLLLQDIYLGLAVRQVQGHLCYSSLIEFNSIQFKAKLKVFITNGYIIVDTSLSAMCVAFALFTSLLDLDKISLSSEDINGVFGIQRRPYLVIDHDDYTLCFY
jgi:hypothetical protein